MPAIEAVKPRSLTGKSLNKRRNPSLTRTLSSVIRLRLREEAPAVFEHFNDVFKKAFVHIAGNHGLRPASSCISEYVTTLCNSAF